MSDIQNKIEELLNEVNSTPINDNTSLETFRIRFLGTKNCLKPLFTELKDVPNEDKKKVGLQINELKNAAQSVFDQFKDQLSNGDVDKEEIDFSRPGEPNTIGARHPISVRSEERRVGK